MPSTRYACTESSSPSCPRRLVVLIPAIVLIAIGLLLEVLTTGVLAAVGWVCVVVGVVLLVVALIMLLAGRSSV